MEELCIYYGLPFGSLKRIVIKSNIRRKPGHFTISFFGSL